MLPKSPLPLRLHGVVLRHRGIFTFTLFTYVDMFMPHCNMYENFQQQRYDIIFLDIYIYIYIYIYIPVHK
jgi:hypothetical protein